MPNLVLMYVMLFILAGLLGLGAGWSLRQFIIVRHVKILEADLALLRREGRAARPGAGQPQTAPFNTGHPHQGQG